MKITFTVHYEAGRSYKETWRDTDIFCPWCGEKKVWCEDHEGDYYDGPTYICIACSGSFTIHLNGHPEREHSVSDLQVLANLLAEDEEHERENRDEDTA